METKKDLYKIELFDKDLEAFLGIDTPKRKDLKPLNIMYQCNKGNIAFKKIEELKEKIISLIE